MFRRLNDHSVAGRESRSDLPGHQEQRVVPGNYAHHHTVRLLHYKVHLMMLNRRDHATGFVTANFGVVIKTGSDPLNLIHVFDEWLATFFSQQLSEILLMLANLPRHPVQQFALFNAGHEAPVVLGFDGSPYSSV